MTAISAGVACTPYAAAPGADGKPTLSVTTPVSDFTAVNAAPLPLRSCAGAATKTSASVPQATRASSEIPAASIPSSFVTRMRIYLVPLRFVSPARSLRTRRSTRRAVSVATRG
jgi:hypothetical protein